METLYIKEKKLETVLSKLKSLSGTPKSYIGQINELYEEKNQLEIEKKEAEKNLQKELRLLVEKRIKITRQKLDFEKINQ